jgi:hypothetical protein
MSIGIGLSPVFGAAGIGYLLKDDFSTNVAAGSVDGSASSPGPGGNRTVVDTDSLLSVATGALAINGGRGTPVMVIPVFGGPR